MVRRPAARVNDPTERLMYGESFELAVYAQRAGLVVTALQHIRRPSGPEGESRYFGPLWTPDGDLFVELYDETSAEVRAHIDRWRNHRAHRRDVDLAAASAAVAAFEHAHRRDVRVSFHTGGLVDPAGGAAVVRPDDVVALTPLGRRLAAARNLDDAIRSWLLHGGPTQVRGMLGAFDEPAQQILDRLRYLSGQGLVDVMADQPSH